MVSTGTTRDRVWGSVITKCPKTQLDMTTDAGPPGAPLKASPPLSLNTQDDVPKHVSLVARTAAVVPSSIENSQLQLLRFLSDAPLKLRLKLLDPETLEDLYNEVVVECTKAKLLGKRDVASYRTNRIRELARHELDYRRTYSPTGENSI